MGSRPGPWPAQSVQTPRAERKVTARLPLAVTSFGFLESDRPSSAQREACFCPWRGREPLTFLGSGWGAVVPSLTTQLSCCGASDLGPDFSPSYAIGPALHTSVQRNQTSCCSLSCLLVLAVLFPGPFHLFLFQALPLFTCT